MTAPNALQQGINPKSLGKGALTGGAIAFILITLFFFGDGGEWDFGFRVYFPTITSTAGGAMGGIAYALLEPLRQQGGWKKAVAILAGLLLYLAAFWLSSVAGMAVTGDWD